jgi:hypothetical protein
VGGWNKGIKGAPGGGMTGKKHSEKTLEKFRNRKLTDEHVAKLKERPKETYNKPKATAIETTETCHYGCDQVAKYQFANKKLCCSISHNSCPAKRKQFSDRNDHLLRAEKSLKTRTELGITKTSQIKGSATRKAAGHYEKLAEKMKEHWAERPWDNNTHCPILEYKNTGVPYQGTYEYDFLQSLEDKHGAAWVSSAVKRGPSVWYIDPTNNTKRLYISDFIIYNTIYEVKSNWTWNKAGTDQVLENRNKAKLSECLSQGYEVVLVLERKEIKYEK